MIKADNYSQELARTQKNLRAVSMERDSEREARQKAEAEVERLRSQLKRDIEIAEVILYPFLRITGVPEQNLAALKEELK